MDAAAAEVREARAAAALPKVPGKVRRALPWVAAAAIVSTVGTTGWLFGLAVGDLPRRDNAVEAIVSTTARATPTPAPGAARPAVPIDLTKVPIRDFDPSPGDGSESSDQVQNAVDLDATTAWNTTRYKSAALGGLKPGVGLLLDLGKPTTLHSIQIGFTAPGTTVELRTADTVGSSGDAFRLVGTSRNSPQLATVALPPDPAAGTGWSGSPHCRRTTAATASGSLSCASSPSMAGLPRPRPFRLLWGGETLSMVGDASYQIVLVWLVLSISHSPAVLAAVLVTGAIPRGLLLLVGGAVSDRFSPLHRHGRLAPGAWRSAQRPHGAGRLERPADLAVPCTG